MWDFEDEQRPTAPSARGTSGNALRFQKPPPLTENTPVAEKYEKWLDWKAVFDVALSVCDAPPTERQKASLLFTSVGPETQRIITLLSLPPMHKGEWNNGTEYEELSGGLNSFFRGMVDETVDYARFHDAKQGAAEGIHAFTLRMRSLASSVNVDPTSFAFRHQILKGMRNKELALKASDMSTPLGELIRIAARKEQREQSASTSGNMWESHGQGQPMVAAMAANQKKDAAKRTATFTPTGAPASKAQSCRYCGGRKHKDKKECPAFGKECKGCGSKNHFVKVCEKSKQKRVNAIAGTAQEASECDPKVEN